MDHFDTDPSIIRFSSSLTPSRGNTCLYLVTHSSGSSTVHHHTVAFLAWHWQGSSSTFYQRVIPASAPARSSQGLREESPHRIMWLPTGYH